MQLVGAGLCSARQDTPNYRKSSANPYALTRLAVEADAGHSRSRRRSVTDVGLPLAGTHRPGRMHRFYGNLRRICNFSMGRQSRRPLQQPFALSVGEDDSVRPRDVPILRESSANSQLPPTSKEVTACASAVPVGDIVCLLVSLTAHSCRRCGGTGARHGCWKCRSGT